MSGPDDAVIRVAARHDGLRADAFFALAFPFLSRTRIRQKIQQGEALLNGRRFATSARLREGDEVRVAWRGPAAGPDAGPPPVVRYEDGWFLALDKPAGQATHPAGGTQAGTLVQQARAYLRPATEAALAAGAPDAGPLLANRLDRFTSGIVLVAKGSAALAAFQALRDRGAVRRAYRAVVAGRVRDDEGVIDAPLAPATVRSDAAGTVGIRMVVADGGLPASTRYRVLERGATHTVLEAVPVTGRQHQIRVHLASIGHPVIGDLLYPDEGPFLRWWENGGRLDATLPARHLLHALSLSFTHPFTGAAVVVEAPVPEDFRAALARL